MITKEEDNFLRTVYLNFRVATRALRRYFDSRHPNLASDLSLYYNKLHNLYKQGILYKAKWDILYPPTGSNTVSSADFDVTLMVCLLRNLPPTVSSPLNGFDALPLSSDMSDGAHIARIKYYKNVLVSNSANGTLSDTFYQNIWSELEKAIHGLGNQQDVDDAANAKSRDLHHELENRIMNLDEIIDPKLDMLENRGTKRTNLENDDTQQSRKRLNDHVKYQYKLDLHSTNLAKLKTAVGNMETEVQSVKTSITVGSHKVDFDFPPFVGTSKDFNKLLSTGTYESFENRVYLCGSCACGKSTLASVLIDSPTPRTWKSTDGLVIYFGRNGINLASYEMVPLKEDDRGHDVLTKVIIGQPNHKTQTTHRADSKQNQHVGASNVGADYFKSHLEDMKKDVSSGTKLSELAASSTRSSEELFEAETDTFESKTITHIKLPLVKKVESYVVRDEILKEIKSGQYKIKIAPSDLVDFGGQRSYDMTHQLFVQHGGTFVVMFDGSREFQEPLKEYHTGDTSNESIVKHWVNSILTYCVDDDDVMPKILFAATHSDLLSEDMRKKKKTEFKEKIEKMFGTHKMKKHIKLDSVFFINGRDKDDHELQSLKKQLVTFAREQPSWGRRLPLIWVPLELMITKMKNDNIHVIPKTYLAEANKMNGDLKLTPKQLDDFLLTQHSLGKIMYFNQPELNNFIIIHPPAMVNILRSFITDEQFWPTDEILKKSLRKMTDTGKINKEDLLNLWKQEKFQNDIPFEDNYKEFIIQVLVHLDVLVLPKRYISGKNAVHVDYFLVPCIVKNKMPMAFLDDNCFAKKTITLVYRLNMSFLPPSLALKLIGAVSSIWPIMVENGRPLLYHSAAVLCVDENTIFRIFVEDSRVIVHLTHRTSKSSISPDIAASLQECLTLTLKAVLNFYLCSIGKRQHKQVDSTLFLIEVGEVCDKSACVVSLSKAKQTSTWMCGRMNQHFSRFPLLWVYKKKELECPTDCPGLEKDLLIMSPSDKQISRVVAQLGVESCRKLVFQLGLQHKDWENLEYQYGKNYMIIGIMAFHFWKKTRIQGKLQTKSFNDLLEALKEIEDERHLLCKVFREDTDLYKIAEHNLQKTPQEDFLTRLIKNIGDCAIQLGIELGITINSVEETIKRYPSDMYCQIADILRKWTQSSPVTPTIYRLMVVLERVDNGGLKFLLEYYHLSI